MKFAFVIYGALLCLLLVYANSNGWVLAQTLSTGKWGPRGQSTYHK